jgi:hypothetical protein
MRWECGECGARAEEEPMPDVCRECGLAGGGFVAAEPEPEDEPRAVWVRAGLERRGVLASRTRR